MSDYPSLLTLNIKADVGVSIKKTDLPAENRDKIWRWLVGTSGIGPGMPAELHNINDEITESITMGALCDIHEVLADYITDNMEEIISNITDAYDSAHCEDCGASETPSGEPRCEILVCPRQQKRWAESVGIGGEHEPWCDRDCDECDHWGINHLIQDIKTVTDREEYDTLAERTEDTKYALNAINYANGRVDRLSKNEPTLEPAWEGYRKWLRLAHTQMEKEMADIKTPTKWGPLMIKGVAVTTEVKDGVTYTVETYPNGSILRTPRPPAPPPMPVRAERPHLVVKEVPDLGIKTTLVTSSKEPLKINKDDRNILVLEQNIKPNAGAGKAPEPKKLPRQPRHCSKCSDTAHDIRDCPVWKAELEKKKKEENNISHA
jgi:hypothetical protein